MAAELVLGDPTSAIFRSAKHQLGNLHIAHVRRARRGGECSGIGHQVHHHPAQPALTARKS